jgi:hypothetical protein
MANTPQPQRRRRRRRPGAALSSPLLGAIAATGAAALILLLTATTTKPVAAQAKPPAASVDALRHHVPTRARTAALNALSSDGDSLRGADTLNALTRGDRAAWGRDAGLTIGGTLAALASPRTLLEVRVVLVGFAGSGGGGRHGRGRVPPNPAQMGGTPEEQAAAAAALHQQQDAAGGGGDVNAHPFISTRDLQVVLDALHAHATAASLGPGRPRRMLAEADVLFRASLPAADAGEGGGPDALARRIGEAVASAARAANPTRAYTREHDLHLVPVGVMDALIAEDFAALNAREGGSGGGHGRLHMPSVLGSKHPAVDPAAAAAAAATDPAAADQQQHVGEGPGHGHAALTLYVVNPHHPPGVPPYAYSYHNGGFEMDGAPDRALEPALLPTGGGGGGGGGSDHYAWTPPRLLTGRGGCPGPLNVGPPGQRYAWIDLAANVSYWGPGPGGEGQVFRHLLPHPSQFRPDSAGVAMLPEIAALAWSGVQHLAWPPLHHGGRRLGFRPRVAVRLVRLHQALAVDSDDAGGGLDARALQADVQAAVDAAAGAGLQTVEVTEHRLPLPLCDYCAVAMADALRTRTARVPGPPGQFEVAESRRLDGAVLRRWLSRSRSRLLSDAGVPLPGQGVVTSDLTEMAVFVFDLDTTGEFWSRVFFFWRGAGGGACPRLPPPPQPSCAAIPARSRLTPPPPPPSLLSKPHPNHNRKKIQSPSCSTAPCRPSPCSTARARSAPRTRARRASPTPTTRTRSTTRWTRARTTRAATWARAGTCWPCARAARAASLCRLAATTPSRAPTRATCSGRCWRRCCRRAGAWPTRPRASPSRRGAGGRPCGRSGARPLGRWPRTT